MHVFLWYVLCVMTNMGLVWIGYFLSHLPPLGQEQIPAMILLVPVALVAGLWQAVLSANTSN